MVDPRFDIAGKIFSYLHLPNGHDFWNFCCSIPSAIFEGCKWLNAHKERILALFFFVLEVISVVLDQIGKDKETYLLAAFLLSVFGFAITLYSFIEPRPNQTVMAETQLKVVEIVFSVIQSIVAYVHYLLTVLKVKNDYNASAFPLAFAMISVVFVFLKDGKITDPSPEDRTPANIQPPATIPSTSELGQIVSSDNQVRALKEAKREKREEKKRDEKKREEKKPEQKKPEQKKREEKKREEKKPEEKRREKKKREEKKPEQKKPQQKKPKEKRREKKKLEEKKPEQKKPEQKKPEEKKREKKRDDHKKEP